MDCRCNRLCRTQEHCPADQCRMRMALLRMLPATIDHYLLPPILPPRPATLIPFLPPISARRTALRDFLWIPTVRRRAHTPRMVHPHMIRPRRRCPNMLLRSSRRQMRRSSSSTGQPLSFRAHQLPVFLHRTTLSNFLEGMPISSSRKRAVILEFRITWSLGSPPPRPPRLKLPHRRKSQIFASPPSNGLTYLTSSPRPLVTHSLNHLILAARPSCSSSSNEVLLGEVREEWLHHSRQAGESTRQEGHPPYWPT